MTTNPVPRTLEEADELAIGGEDIVPPSLRGLLAGLAAAIGQPGPLSREAIDLAKETLAIVRGRSELAPHPKDRRFGDPAWTDNGAFRRGAQLYLALADALGSLVDELEATDPDWRRVEQARFAATVLSSAIAPTNYLPTNPSALKRAFDTGGRSLVRGLGNFVEDVRHNGGMPAQTDRSAFEVGRDLALTPGAVVHRDEVLEVIQYGPSTETVHAAPVLIVPPPIGRYYFLDLRPGRSFVEYAVSRGLQVFLISWRNPGPAQADWDLDTYARAVLRAIDTSRTITDAEEIHALGFCAGGLILSTVLNHLADQPEPSPVATASFAVTLLDFDQPAPLGAFSSTHALKLARGNSRRKGIISGRTLGRVFSWMRPDDLIFNYVVNNYLLGETPPVFDILAWNADTTNLPAALHQQFLEVFEHNRLCEPGGLTVLGTDVDLASIEVPVFVTGAMTDHLTPWKGCYRTTQLVGGDATFVLSNAGHIASLVNPPGNPKASYHVGGPPVGDPDEWLADAEARTGSWWEEWGDWISSRAGERVTTPADLGSADYPPQDPAPGRYVLDLTV